MSIPRRARVESGIYKRPDGCLEIGWRDASGKQRWRRVDGGILAARASLAAEHTKRHRGERVSNPQLTFDAAIEAAWQQRSPRLARSSQVVYGASIKRLRAHFGTRKLRDITAGDVAAYVVAHRELSRETLRKDLSMVSAGFNHAKRHLDFSGSNPVLLLDRDELPRGESKTKRILSASELRELLLATAPRFRLAVRTLADTGLRLSELLGLDIATDLDGDVLAVNFQLDPRTRERAPLKTARSRRALTITEGLAAELRDVGSFPLTHSQIERAVAAAAKRAELGHVTPHDLRHTHASALIAAGWDIERVSRRLGHANSAITLTTYTHEYESGRSRDDERRSLDALYGAEPQPRSNVIALDRAQGA